MASNSFVLKNVVSLNHEELGRGSYGRVYKVKYCETICAAKEVHSALVDDLQESESRRITELFSQEFGKCSMFRHPNIVQFLGVYYPHGEAGTFKTPLPVIVMEKLADSLTSYVDKHKSIPVHIKYSVVHDVSHGLCYLHNHDPPIVHQNLSPSNVLLTPQPVAKISCLGMTKVIKAKSKKKMLQVPDFDDFMAPEALGGSPVYGPPMDVFSFAGIILYTFTQQWPKPTELIQFESKTKMLRWQQQYLDRMTGRANALRPLVEECLNYDPAVRPTITNVCKRIQVCMDAYMKDTEFSQDIITLYQHNTELKDEITRKSFENENLRSENVQMNSIIEKYRTLGKELMTKRSKLRMVS